MTIQASPRAAASDRSRGIQCGIADDGTEGRQRAQRGADMRDEPEKTRLDPEERMRWIRHCNRLGTTRATRLRQLIFADMGEIAHDAIIGVDQPDPQSPNGDHSGAILGPAVYKPGTQ
jgi:hypothetical protein